MGDIFGMLYGIAFLGSLVFVYHDAKARKRTLPLIHVLGVALIAPIGIFVYLWMRD